MIQFKDDIESVARKAFFLPNRSTIGALHRIEQRESFPPNLLVGIFLIESTARPLYARILEYVCVIASLVGHRFFEKPVRSYTIGKFQLGLPRIINYLGGNAYVHSPYVVITPSLLIRIPKAMREDVQIEILADEISEFYQRALNIFGNSNLDNIYTYIGEQYNGRYSYGLLLGSVVNKLNEWSEIYTNN